TCTIFMEPSPHPFSNCRYLRVARYHIHFRVRTPAFQLQRCGGRRRSPPVITGETAGGWCEIAPQTASGTLSAGVKLRAARRVRKWVPEPASNAPRILSGSERNVRHCDIRGK